MVCGFYSLFFLSRYHWKSCSTITISTSDITSPPSHSYFYSSLALSLSLSPKFPPRSIIRRKWQPGVTWSHRHATGIFIGSCCKLRGSVHPVSEHSREGGSPALTPRRRITPHGCHLAAALSSVPQPSTPCLKTSSAVIVYICPKLYK